MQDENIKDLAVAALEEMKCHHPIVVDVAALTSIASFMVIASGTSNRHVKSLADSVLRAAKEAGLDILGVEGQQQGEWVLVDLGGVIVHVMLPETRAFYDLERLWTEGRLVAPAVGS